MNRIKELFSRKKEKILSVYFTAGYPNLHDTGLVIEALTKAGMDMIEIGMPYSDPLADGPVIQHSSTIALKNGMNMRLLFQQLKDLKSLSDDLPPLILMGYLNPVLQFGFEKFCRDASRCGISGLILPDLPFREYEKDYKGIMEKYNLKFIFLITPDTSEERIRKMDNLSDAFIYAVSSSSVTGRVTDEDRKESYFKRLRDMKLKNPVLVGFGVRDKRTFEHPCKYLNGAIVGTAFIQKLDQGGNIEKIAQEFEQSLR